MQSVKYKDLRNIPYGMELYNAYRQMGCRCLSNSDNQCKYYKERQIKVCDEWQKSFMSFYKWSIENVYKYEPLSVKNNPNRTLNKWSIDRIDGNKGYSPDNCRWVDIHTQNNNRRKPKVILTKKDYTKTITSFDYAEFLKLVKKKNKKLKDVQKAMGLHRSSFYRSLEKNANFTASSIRGLVELLGNEVLDIFFPNAYRGEL